MEIGQSNWTWQGPRMCHYCALNFRVFLVGRLPDLIIICSKTDSNIWRKGILCFLSSVCLYRQTTHFQLRNFFIVGKFMDIHVAKHYSWSTMPLLSIYSVDVGWFFIYSNQGVGILWDNRATCYWYTKLLVWALCGAIGPLELMPRHVLCRERSSTAKMIYRKIEMGWVSVW